MKYNTVSFLTSMISIPGFRRYRRFATVMRRYPISVADKASRTCRSNVQQFGRVCREDKFLVIVSSDRPRKSLLSRYQVPFSSHPPTLFRPLQKPDCKARATGYR
ncbi:hypothetical protein ALC57_11477 [Trachymyrmex cornetzi]|uniref:Uncharacterized protein n=1 Tax=Trachymyrmex cornetzi TaxID=471704 RepID=A0A195DTS7_9HYME|nr:hypothetical protein ALC57_11477 [Trachymyrmex cornetzi]